MTNTITGQAQASDYDIAMGRDPAGHQAAPDCFAFSSHQTEGELTGDLAQARDTHARAEIDRAAAGFRQRTASKGREAGA